MNYVRRVGCSAAIAALALYLAMPLMRAAAAEEGGSDILSRDAILRDADIPSLGNADGDLTIVEYFDYQCPYCKKTAPLLARIAKEDGKIRLVAKDWPIFGPVSSYAARIVLAAKYQGKYVQAHEAVMNAKGKLTEDAVRKLMTKAGVDVTKATNDLKEHQAELDKVVARNTTQAQAFGFLGTPAFIIGTFRVASALSEAGFRHAIADARKAAAAK